MPPTTSTPASQGRIPTPPRTPPRTTSRSAGLPGRQAAPPFSAVVLAEPSSPLTERIEASLTAAGARDIRYAASPADLLRRIPAPVESGIGVICRSPHAEAIVQLVAAMRQRGWRRLVIACHDGDETAIRLAIASKVRCLVRRSESGLSGHLVAGLSAREVEVLQAVADGRTNNEVGELLGLSGLTVKSHLARIGRKTGSGDRAQMVALAMRAGLVQ